MSTEKKLGVFLLLSFIIVAFSNIFSSNLVYYYSNGGIAISQYVSLIIRKIVFFVLPTVIIFVIYISKNGFSIIDINQDNENNKTNIFAIIGIGVLSFIGIYFLEEIITPSLSNRLLSGKFETSFSIFSFIFMLFSLVIFVFVQGVLFQGILYDSLKGMKVIYLIISPILFALGSLGTFSLLSGLALGVILSFFMWCSKDFMKTIIVGLICCILHSVTYILPYFISPLYYLSSIEYNSVIILISLLVLIGVFLGLFQLLKSLSSSDADKSSSENNNEQELSVIESIYTDSYEISALGIFIIVMSFIVYIVDAIFYYF